MAQCVLLRHVTLNSKCNSDDVCYFSLYFNVFLEYVQIHRENKIRSAVPVLYFPILKCILYSSKGFKLESVFSTKMAPSQNWFCTSVIYEVYTYIGTTSSDKTYLFYS